MSESKNGGCRPAQFAAYRALKGYEEMLKEQSREKEPRVNLSEEAKEILSNQLRSVKKGDEVAIKYYENDVYEVKEGVVNECDELMQVIRVDRKKIQFSDLLWVRKKTSPFELV